MLREAGNVGDDRLRTYLTDRLAPGRLRPCCCWMAWTRSPTAHAAPR
ncbi:MAG: hypothetical protein V9H69_21105 [Anaerolineae bacterium]